MSVIATAKAIGKKLFGKKPKEVEKFKTDTSKYPTTKNIDELIKNEQDPFVRNKLISMKKSKARGDVKDKGGNIMGTPNKERSAESIAKYVKGAKDGGRMGYKDGSKGCGKANKGKGRAYGQNS
ncbi:hypothetical protein OAV76_04130 [Schleiferiaceae bacterium]|nr:hypothetical protein [Schleiferiaceae bacterium]